MACPRVFFDVTAGGQPVGRVIMEVSLLMFRRNLTIFFRDDITLGVRTNAMFLPVIPRFFFECHKIWFLGCFSLLCSLLGRYLLTYYQFILNFCEN